MKFFHEIDLEHFDNVLEDLNFLIEKNLVQWHSNQICINSTREHLNDVSYGTGSLTTDWSKMTVQSGVVQNIKIKDYFEKEENFTELNEVFYNTEIEKIFYSIKSRFNVGRVRFMRSLPHTCLSWHKDDTNRLHYPLVTHNGCRMVIEDECAFLPEKTWWATNAKLPHSAFNGSKSERIHLVASLLDYEFNTHQTF